MFQNIIMKSSGQTGLGSFGRTISTMTKTTPSVDNVQVQICSFSTKFTHFQWQPSQRRRHRRRKKGCDQHFVCSSEDRGIVSLVKSALQRSVRMHHQIRMTLFIQCLANRLWTVRSALLKNAKNIFRDDGNLSHNCHETGHNVKVKKIGQILAINQEQNQKKL